MGLVPEQKWMTPEHKNENSESIENGTRKLEKISSTGELLLITPPRPMRLPVRIGETNITDLMDSGATISLLRKEF